MPPKRDQNAPTSNATEIESEVSRLKVQRRNIKQKVSSIAKYVSDITETTQIDIHGLTARLDNLHRIYQEFEEVQLRLDLTRCNGDDEEESIDPYAISFDKLYYDTLASGRAVLDTFNSSHLQPSPREASQSLQNPSTPKVNIKLPIMHLPKFSGKLSEWCSFYDTVKNALYDNPELSNVQKLQYLKSCLEGEALNKISFFEITDANFILAWDTLKEKYDNKRRIVENHVHDILSLPTLKKDSFNEFRNFLSTIENNLKCLDNLKQPIIAWDAILVPIVVKKLPQVSVNDWEEEIAKSDHPKEVPKFTELIKFLNKKLSVLESCSFRRNQEIISTPSHVTKPTKAFATTTHVPTKCAHCNQNHFLTYCEAFIKLSAGDKYKLAKQLQLCTNCLRPGHSASYCQSTSCRICQKRHHTVLHFENKPQSNSGVNMAMNSQSKVEVHNYSSITQTKQVMLPTALVIVRNKGKTVTLRALLDSASQSNFVCESVCSALKLDLQPTSIKVNGIGHSSSFINKSTQLKIESRTNNYKTLISCLVIKNIGSALPSSNINCETITIPNSIRLADESFHVSNTVDLLLGAEVFFNLLSIGQIQTDDLIYQKSKLGWLVCGPLNAGITACKTSSFLTLNTLNKNIEKFWDIEDCKQQTLSPSDQYCEDLYKSTTKHDIDSKFTVALPLKRDELHLLGDSYEVAKSRFLALEKRFMSNPTYKQEYLNVMHDYIKQGHASPSSCEGYDEFFLPHHSVTKESTSTKLRIVFNASSDSTGLSINALQHTGPAYQNEIFNLMIRFRLPKFILTGDIKQMYRQIWVRPEDRRFQKFVWRDHSSEELKVYELKTLTFGFTSAPFLAQRTMKEIAVRNKSEFPLEAAIIERDSYMDDLFIGAETVEKLRQTKQNLINLFDKYRFTLTKFNSNIPALSDNPDVSATNNMLKILGIQWCTKTDTLLFSFPEHNETRVTKRIILSSIAKLFDPIGLLGPILVIPKILLQELWKLSLDWDESVPGNIHTAFTEFCTKRANAKIAIKRRITLNDSTKHEIHGFCDASQKAYGACLYLKTINDHQETSVHLIASKSRIAPVKTVTLPRLELMGAVLLARLIAKFRTVSKQPYVEFMWCDSTIVLHWIRSEPSRWTTFVANRVATIQRATPIANWRHVSTNHNPADLLSRGSHLCDLNSNSLWWNGPTFLLKENYENILIPPTKILEQRQPANVSFIAAIDHESIIKRFSSFHRLLRVTSYCYRLFDIKYRKKKYDHKYLTARELNETSVRLIKLSQRQHFHDELQALTKNNTISKKSTTLNLNPFIDNEGLLRVGGRINLSHFHYNKKHPIILAKQSHLTELIARNLHESLHHAGPSVVLAQMREKYWPIAGQNLIKKIVRTCVKCFKCNPKSQPPKMGQLPPARTLATFPFYVTGVDYAGPFHIKNKHGRGARHIKSYLAVFVCLATKCVHLELVSALSTDAFLNALTRFISRRGKPSAIHSDNGTNFKGAQNKLTEWYEFLRTNNEVVAEKIENQSIEWHFNPPSAPHMGGLWEAAVKSAKFYLKRSMDSITLTYEDMYTLLCKIEAILNSRPLIPLTSDPSDIQALTPYHFLIGRSAISVAEPIVTHLQLNRLNNFQVIQRILQAFWKKWSSAYIATLQQRTKWKQDAPNLKLDTLVVLKDDGLLPGQWRLGRVIAIHPGNDGIVRVATVKCQNGQYTRCVSKLCPLPID